MDPYTSIAIPSTYIQYPLITSSSMDIPSTSQSTLIRYNSSLHLGTTFDEQLVITTLLWMSEGEKRLSKRLGCSQVKGDLESERPLVSSKMESENERESTILACWRKRRGWEGDECEPGWDPDEIKERNWDKCQVQIQDDKTLQFVSRIDRWTTQRPRGSWRPSAYLLF